MRERYLQLLTFLFVLALVCTSYEILSHLNREYKNSMFNKME